MRWVDRNGSEPGLVSGTWSIRRAQATQHVPNIRDSLRDFATVTRKALYSEMGHLVRDEGGLICPMFNDFIDGVSDKLVGWEVDPNGELMNGQVTRKLSFA